MIAAADGPPSSRLTSGALDTHATHQFQHLLELHLRILGLTGGSLLLLCLRLHRRSSLRSRSLRFLSRSRRGHKPLRGLGLRLSIQSHIWLWLLRRHFCRSDRLPKTRIRLLLPKVKWYFHGIGHLRLIRVAVQCASSNFSWI